ncbi:Pc20g12860 [Penicillium rubens Wisconsin 54-1255]|uniref:Pc20g12860 protein n=1 Tax=Penicillium rubens (strain ATCC 28089 / DSM 1075 / NRRL 1951 / Wisconsin 54-1255) TaxID=500485 RepID=B6HGM7_PENRW|nr:Pc20g12860 [Penicillium rubens Wisconsin 54-1255]
MDTRQPCDGLAQPDSPPQTHLASRDSTNSLEDLLRNAGDYNESQHTQETTSEPPALIDPFELPLPASRPPSTRMACQGDQMVDPAELVPHEVDATGPPSYEEIIQNAGKVLEHIKNGNVGKNSRHERTSITYYDYIGNFISETGHIDDSVNIAALCHVSADRLGETFSINPEFFEEHLLNSGYAGGKYDNPPARNWSTALFEKSYMSFRWIRPVYRLPTYFSGSDLGDLLDDSTTHFTRGKVGLVDRSQKDRENEKVIVLFDPLPEISEMHQYWAPVGFQGENGEAGDDSDADDDMSHYYSMIEDEPQRVRDQRSLAKSLDWLIGKKKRKGDKHEKNREVLNTVIIEQIASRQAISVDLDRVFQTTQSVTDLEEKLKETKSTKLEICDALRMHREPLSVVKPLFGIVKQDTMTLLNQLRQVLDEIDIEILDDTMMEDRLGLWRQIINRAQRELPELRSSIGPFIEFLIGLQSITFSTELAAVRLEVMQDKDELCKDIDHIIDRIRRTSASLTSNMGLLDSRRSIDEAHAVARLTELAFIFVPMSFAASVFGMQVEPFADPVPLGQFFIVAVVVTSFAYLMRMTMCSHWLIDLKVAVRHDARRYAERNGQPVQAGTLPMLLVFRSIATRLGTRIARTCKWATKRTISAAERLWAVFGFVTSFVLLNGMASGIPLAVLWTCELDSSIQYAVTIPIVLVVIVVVGVPFWFRSKPEFRNALPDFIMDGVRHAPFWVRMTLIYLILTATFIAVPLALIWTGPLATGIKSGLTVGVAMVMILVVLIVTLFGVSGPRRKSANFVARHA